MVFRDAYVVKVDLACAAAFPAELILVVSGFISDSISRNHEPCKSAHRCRIKLTCFAHYESVIAYSSVCCEDLTSVDDPFITIKYCRSLIFSHVEYSARFCGPVTQEDISFDCRFDEHLNLLRCADIFNRADGYVTCQCSEQSHLPSLLVLL